ncbi:hypothetical protein IMG5_110280 [Ichthyophthirius multifiliis]|uniref:Uncharacterized protein n=1 Tax=Ichthyophthirius multifiliis TaxID=5932 RepID=G0QTN9_ICHMU|nr:hypothetical protein IMG5_110280 [Ichthyophthirius multifiliis]EGR31412.1 hypothetical protein IMG5_110280 [Ichthyophthirius multifiliis]|eukprot:XP_004034898.1 hypothetical protein IMG5_110280 [Ichthyophthirius multifiliis]
MFSVFPFFSQNSYSLFVWGFFLINSYRRLERRDIIQEKIQTAIKVYNLPLDYDVQLILDTFSKVGNIKELRQLICGQLIQVSSQSIFPYSSNKQETTYYQFQFVPQTIIEKDAFIEVTFPSEFLANAIPKRPECSIKKENDQYFQQVPCVTINNRIVRADVQNILKNIFTIVIGQITNPQYKDQSGQFSIRTTYLEVTQDYSDTFGYVGFAPPPLIIQDPQIYRISNYRISEGSSWEFQFRTQNSYGPGNSLRFTFPEGYRSLGVGCDIVGQFGKTAKAILAHNYRTITCQSVNKNITDINIARVINMINPDFSGIMQGFKIEVLELDSSLVLEKVEFGGNIQIEPGIMKISYISSDSFKWSKSLYSFFINLVNPVGSNDRLYLNFTNEWKLNAKNCTIVNGFEQKKNEMIYCYLIPEANAYRIENFEKIDSTKRLVLSVEVESPHYENQYPVTIATYNTLRNAVVDMNTVDIMINQTYGVLEKFSVNPVQAPITLRAGEIGPLEITLFLKTQLPKTDVGTFGKFRIDIFPQILKPEPQYGKLVCFFYADKYSGGLNGENCDKDWELARTDRTALIYLTPLAYSFKESEIPITVTTQGNFAGKPKGVQLNPLVQRYLFHIHMWKFNGNIFTLDSTGKEVPPGQPPDEVYFTEFIPKPDAINDGSAKDVPNPAGQISDLSATVYSAGQFTNIQMKYNHLNDFIKDYTLRKPENRNYIIRIEFIGSAWETNLGWGNAANLADGDQWRKGEKTLGFTSKHNYLIKNYPCQLEGNIWEHIDLTQKASNCDLNIREQKESLNEYPYLQVNLLQTNFISKTSYIKITIPKIKISNNVDYPAIINFKILEETPGQRDPIVPICQIDNKQIFVVTKFTPLSPQVITATQNNLRLNTKDIKYTYTFPQSNLDLNYAVIIELPKVQMLFGPVACTGGTCLKYDYPVNWIVFTPNIAQLTTAKIEIIENFITNPAYNTQFTINSYVWFQQQLVNIGSGTITYPYMTMTGGIFKLEETTQLYQSNQVKNTISFTLEEALPDNGYISLTFNCHKLNTVTNFFFATTGITALDNQGIRYIADSDSKLVIFNLMTIAKSSLVTIVISLQLPSTLICLKPLVTVELGYEFKTALNSGVMLHSPSPLSSHQIPSNPLISSTDTKYSNSHFLYLYATVFTDFTVQWAHSTPGQYNMFIFSFTVSQDIPAYDLGGRLQLEFPTSDDEGFAFNTDLKYNPGILSPINDESTIVGTVGETFLSTFKKDTSKIVHQMKIALIQGDFYVTELPVGYFNLPYKENKGNLEECKLSTTFEYCIVFEDSNWVVRKAKAALVPTVTGNIELFALTDRSEIDNINFQSYIWSQGKLTNVVLEVINKTAWDAAQGLITNLAIDLAQWVTYGDASFKVPVSKKQVDIVVSFKIANQIPAEGSIEIRFKHATPFKIYPNCKSHISGGSQLLSAAQVDVAQNGEIGCAIQQDYSWYITGFKKISGSNDIQITGQIDIPSTVAPISVQVFTYANQDDSQINLKGKIIDKSSPVDSIFTIGKPASFIDGNIFLQQSEPLKINYQGFFKVQVNSQYLEQDITFVFQRVSGTIQGFKSLFANRESIVCFAQNVDNPDITIPLFYNFNNYLTDIAAPNLSNDITIKCEIETNLLIPNKDYVITLGLQDKTTGVLSGLTSFWPSNTGIFNVIISSKAQTNYHIEYIEIYPEEFTLLELISTNNLSGQSNLLIFTFTPKVKIAVDYDYLIIELNTKSLDGTSVFDDDLGLSSYENLNKIPADVQGKANLIATCRISRGLSANNIASKIICFFNADISTSDRIMLFLHVQNPNILLYQMYIPVIVYTQTKGKLPKTNWSILEFSYFVVEISSAKIYNNDSFDPSKYDNNITLKFSLSASISNIEKYYFVVQFNLPYLPLSSASPSCSVGNIYVLINNKMLVCQLTSPIATNFIEFKDVFVFEKQSILYTADQLKIMGWAITRSNALQPQSTSIDFDNECIELFTWDGDLEPSSVILVGKSKFAVKVSATYTNLPSGKPFDKFEIIDDRYMETEDNLGSGYGTLIIENVLAPAKDFIIDSITNIEFIPTLKDALDKYNDANNVQFDSKPCSLVCRINGKLQTQCDYQNNKIVFGINALFGDQFRITLDIVCLDSFPERKILGQLNDINNIQDNLNVKIKFPPDTMIQDYDNKTTGLNVKYNKFQLKTVLEDAPLRFLIRDSQLNMLKGFKIILENALLDNPSVPVKPASLIDVSTMNGQQTDLIIEIFTDNPTMAAILNNDTDYELQVKFLTNSGFFIKKDYKIIFKGFDNIAIDILYFQNYITINNMNNINNYIKLQNFYLTSKLKSDKTSMYIQLQTQQAFTLSTKIDDLYLLELIFHQINVQEAFGATAYEDSNKFLLSQATPLNPLQDNIMNDKKHKVKICANDGFFLIKEDKKPLNSIDNLQVFYESLQVSGATINNDLGSSHEAYKQIFELKAELLEIKAVQGIQKFLECLNLDYMGRSLPVSITGDLTIQITGLDEAPKPTSWTTLTLYMYVLPSSGLKTTTTIEYEVKAKIKKTDTYYFWEAQVDYIHHSIYTANKDFCQFLAQKSVSQFEFGMPYFMELNYNDATPNIFQFRPPLSALEKDTKYLIKGQHTKQTLNFVKNLKVPAQQQIVITYGLTMDNIDYQYVNFKDPFKQLNTQYASITQEQFNYLTVQFSLQSVSGSGIDQTVYIELNHMNWENVGNEIIDLAFTNVYVGNFGQDTINVCNSAPTKPIQKQKPDQNQYSIAISRGRINLYSEGFLKFVVYNQHTILEGSTITLELPYDIFEPALPLDYKFLQQTAEQSPTVLIPNTTKFDAADGQIIKIKRIEKTCKYEITGFKQINPSTSTSIIQITLGYKIKKILLPANFYIKYEVKGPNGGVTESQTLNNQWGSSANNIYLSDQTVELPLITGIKENYQYIKYIDSEQVGPLSFQFKLSTNSIQSVEITIPNDFQSPAAATPALTPTEFYLRYQKTNQAYWVYSPDIKSIENTMKLTFPLSNIDYQIQANQQYTAIIEGFQLQQTYKYPKTTNYKYMLFFIKAIQASLQQEYKRIYYVQDPLPIKAADFKFIALHKEYSHWTVYRIQVITQVEVKLNDEIWIEFESKRGAWDYDQASGDYLGTTYKRKTLDCTEKLRKIVSDKKLICELFQRGEYGLRNIWPKIRILITKDIAKGNNIDILIAGIKNPPNTTLVVGVKLSIRTKALQDPKDFPLVARQINYSFFQPNSIKATIYAPQPSNYQNSLTAEGTTHSKSVKHKIVLGFSSAPKVGDWICIYYTLNNNSEMSEICQAPDECFIFPTLGQVIVKINNSFISAALPANHVNFSIDQMNNGLYRYAGNFNIEYWDNSGNLVQAYTTEGLKYEYDNKQINNDPLGKPYPQYSVEFQPTLTPLEPEFINKYWLSDFWNIAQIKIKGLWRYSNIKTFWITLPRQIDTYDKRYCNATIIDTVLHKPYPSNFNCVVLDRIVGLELTETIPKWEEGKHDTLEMQIYLKFFIKEFQQPIETDCFWISTSVATILNTNLDKLFQLDEYEGVTLTCKAINISPYIQPNLKELTFNTLSFYDRKARPNQDVELYMLLQPKTSVNQFKVDRILFRIPEEFNYPPVQYFNDCRIIGKTDEKAQLCMLERKFARTYITVIPNNDYDHSVKIIKIQDNADIKLTKVFLKSPLMPGNKYNITANLYSGNRLLEKTTINMASVVGFLLPELDYKIISNLDFARKSLYIFKFKIGNQIAVPAGYDSQFATVYSSIDFMFETNQGFLKNLGTGLDTGDQLGCVSPTLKTTVKKRLRCTLKVGTGPEDLPKIIVQDYEAIPINQSVVIYITDIQTLQQFEQVNIKVGVKFYQKKKNDQPYVYDPLSTLNPTIVDKAVLDLLPSGAPAIPNEIIQMDPIIDNKTNKVWDTFEYTFKFKGIPLIQKTDYIVFRFPKDYFYRFSDYSSVEAIVDGKKATDIFVFVYVAPDIIVGGHNGMAYKFYFKIGHQIPDDQGAVSIVFPSLYKYNLYTMEAQCNPLNFPETSKVSCAIGSSNRVDVFLNGFQYNENNQYGVVVSNVNSPNEIMDLNMLKHIQSKEINTA